MESSRAGLGLVLRDANFNPAQSDEAERPQVVEVGDSLSPMHYEVRVKKFGGVVCPFPRSCLVLFRLDFNPLFSSPVQNIDGIESLFIRSPAPKDHNPIILFIVVHGAIGPVGGHIALGLDFCPLHCDCIERPDIIHVV